MKYFCYNPTDDTVTFYPSAAEARHAALHAIEHATDGEWHQETLGICWGRVMQRADVRDLHEHDRASACVLSGGVDGLCAQGVPVEADYGGRVGLVPAEEPADDRKKAYIAVLEAENARLKVRAEAREAQLRHAQARLRLLGHPAADVESVCSGLEASGAATVANWWDGFGDAEAIITVTPGREAEVDAAMLAIAFYPSGRGAVGEGVRYYSTDGTPPWEAPDEAVVSRGRVGC